MLFDNSSIEERKKMNKLRVGVIGATGMVGQQFISLLCNHPWFEVTLVAASPKSAGKTYTEAVEGRWLMKNSIPSYVADMEVENAFDVKRIASEVDLMFSAISSDKLSKGEIAQLEEQYARCEIPVVSNNSSHRWTPDVPMVIPEVNHRHLEIIENQRHRLGTRRGFVVAKPNCATQGPVSAIYALQEFHPYQIILSTYQAVSGAGKTLDSWLEMRDNVIPNIAGEVEKSEQEPLKILGNIYHGTINRARDIVISAQCIRVPVSDGHLSAVFMKTIKKPSCEQIIEKWRSFTTLPQDLCLPSAPTPFITYFNEEDRPQTRIDRNQCKGMGISLGRLCEDPVFDYKFVTLSNNIIRGAAGGAILLAELLRAQKYIG